MKARCKPFALVLSFLLAACGGGAPPPQAPAAPAKEAAVAAAPVDLSEVEAPKGLFALARLRKPSDVLRVAGDWTHLPMPGPDVVSELVMGQTVGALLDLDQPVDFAVATDASKHSMAPLVAASASIGSMESAKRALSDKFKLVPGENGALLVQDASGEEDPEGGGRVCEIAPAAGASAARLVCATGAAGLHELAPYLTRTTPRKSVPSDLHVELHLPPVKTYVALARGMMPALLGGMLDVHRSKNPAGADLLDAVTNDFADLAMDLDEVSLDANLDEARIRWDVRATFQTTKSFLARLATSHPDRADVPPSLFWRLPADADEAIFGRGFDTKDLERPRDLVLAFVGHALEEKGLAEADRKPLLDALSHAVTTSAPFAFARGVDIPAVDKSLAAMGSASDEVARAQAKRAAAEQAAGYWIGGFEEPPSRLQAAAKELVAAWNRPGMTKWIRQQVTAGSPPPSLRTVPLSAALGLPKGSTHLELTLLAPTEAPAPTAPGVPKGGKAPKLPAPKAAKPLALHIFVVPEGGRVWLAVGANEALVAGKVRATLSGMPDSGTLASRAGLESMKTSRVSGGGFATLTGLLTSSIDAVDDIQHGRGLGMFRALASLPDRGASPVTFTTTAVAGSADSPAGSLTGSAVLPKALVEDIVRVVMQGRI